MRQLNIIFGLSILATIMGCSKDSPILEQNEWYGTVANDQWMQTVTNNDLIGNWKIYQITYLKETGQTAYFDTTYLLNAPLALNANGTGMLYN